MFLSLRVLSMLFQQVINFPFRFVPVPEVGIQSYFLSFSLCSTCKAACLILCLDFLFTSQHNLEKKNYLGVYL